DVRRHLPALAEHLDVRMPEPVDRLELVADEEHFLLARPAGEEVDQLALQPIRVLELIDHHGPEPELLAGANRGVVAQKVARAVSTEPASPARHFAASRHSASRASRLGRSPSSSTRSRPAARSVS